MRVEWGSSDFPNFGEQDPIGLKHRVHPFLILAENMAMETHQRSSEVTILQASHDPRTPEAHLCGTPLLHLSTHFSWLRGHAVIRGLRAPPNFLHLHFSHQNFLVAFPHGNP